MAGCIEVDRDCPASIDSRCEYHAAVATGVWSISKTIGVSLPKARCLRRRRWLRSTQVTMASRSSARVDHRCRSSTLHRRSAKSHSMAASPPHTATRPIDPCNPLCGSAPTNLRDPEGVGIRVKRGIDWNRHERFLSASRLRCLISALRACLASTWSGRCRPSISSTPAVSGAG